ncbi:ATP-dependent RecD-like DNA helicase [Lentisphaera profundi]|uniref:ATP-dependent RecD-like DNA helicase n=1 Tax=Lentisphaera profundi TaxID=1658616 RepID=A0ABY7VZE4_9BACT|nr:ATP-dependent RecD-like DNA helicase [Lentisphaera profundi]WDE99169.1 ATP-dependent RecD-like DNA helicase [Lentisphaera profundi]
MSDLFSYKNEEPEEMPLGKHTIFASVLRHLFVSDDNAYCVSKFFADELGEITAVGEMLSTATPGQEIEATGTWIKHKQYGRQFKIDSFTIKLPSSEIGMIRYLSENLPGIGKKTAESIVKHFGAKTFDILDNYTARLKEVPGLGKKRIEEISRTWEYGNQERNLKVFLQGLGLSARQCCLIMEQYGDRSAAVIKDNPYLLAENIRGIGFIQADKLAQTLGIEPTNPFRTASGIVHTIKTQSLDGHTCMPKEFLLGKAQEILKVETKYILEGLERALSDGTIISETHQEIDYLYERYLHKDEEKLIEHLAAFIKLDKQYALTPSQFDLANGELNAEQKQAVQTSFDKRISIITGGPGVGKTTTVKEIVKQARKNGKRIRLAAPTGRAAQRLGEASGAKALTIHRLLMSDGESDGEFIYNESKKLKCDILVVDEVSMLDLSLARKLFAAIDQNETHLVLVGDPDQLPSVGPGFILNDLIQSQLIPVTALHQVFRQAASSRIITNAHRINAGHPPDLSQSKNQDLDDFYFIHQDNPEKLFPIIASMIKERIPKKFDIEAKDIQVLMPMNRGKCGCEALNLYLQEDLNNIHKKQFNFGKSRFILGDRVIQTVNNYTKKVFNGDMGYIVDISNEDKNFIIDFDGLQTAYDFEEAEQIRLAYAITIHKSQGSEFPAVIVPMNNSHYIMLKKNLLYTAITRAKSLLILCSSRQAISQCIANKGTRRRFTLLKYKLQITRMDNP